MPESTEELKPVLSIETSGVLCSTCVYFSEENFFEANVNLKNAHAEKIYELIDFVLKSAEVDITGLDCIAVSSGPGSFTGLRIGMSAAKGLAFGASLPVVPVPTFEAFALQICDILPEKSDFIIATKVNADEIYYAQFQIKSNNYIFTESLKILNKKELKNLSGNLPVFGNTEFNSMSDLNVTSPSARFVAKWSRQNREKSITYDYDYLEPDYIKNFTIRKDIKNA